MSAETGFRLDSKKGPGQWAKRAAKASGKLAVAEARRAEAAEKHFTTLEMTADGGGIDRLNQIMFKNALDTGKPPMIFTKPTKEGRDPIDVAFGDKDFTGKNIVELNGDSTLSEDTLRIAQDAYPEGMTIVGSIDSNEVSIADFDRILRPQDAVVFMHPEKQLESTQLDKVA
ncbi:hypothetical protein KDA00_02830 [Candidatus Saccharibacteria bacterium]|nr:hypothetical protein [Candidatus Saccharibacteria bacterium]